MLDLRAYSFPIACVMLALASCSQRPSAGDGGGSGSSSGPDADDADGEASSDLWDTAPDAPVLELGLSPIKRFDFHWAFVPGADWYSLLESIAPGEPFVEIESIVHNSISLEMPLHLRAGASYVLQACNHVGCTDSETVSAAGSMVAAIGYVKASNTGAGDWFGRSVALSRDGNTLAVGAYGEPSHTTGIGGDQADDSAPGAGAVYVLVRDASGQWSQQAYVKASNTEEDDHFGASVALSADGSTLVVGADLEDGGWDGIDPDQTDASNADAGAVYVFVRDPVNGWSQQAYVKASNSDGSDRFGWSVSLSHDGSTFAVGAPGEASKATGIDGDQADTSRGGSGAVYVFVRDSMHQWSQQAYVKASNTDAADWFGRSVALSADGSTLAVGADGEDSRATGIDGDQTDDSASGAGAVYVLVRDAASQWTQQAYLKASNPDEIDDFGWSIALDDDGDTLAVGARYEDDDPLGRGEGTAHASGAVYVFERDAASQWAHRAYLKAFDVGPAEAFGWSVALDGNGDVLAVGAMRERSSATGIGIDDYDESALDTGAVYVFVRDPADAWSPRAYIKAPNTDLGDRRDQFGSAVSISGDASILAIGAYAEDGSTTGIGGDWADLATPDSGAVYLY